MMNPHEHLIVMVMAGLQFGKPYLFHPQFFPAYKKLASDELEGFHKLVKEVHVIFNHINLPEFIKKELSSSANSILEYNEKIKSVSKLILQIASDYEIITLKETLVKEELEHAQQVLGSEYSYWLDKS